MEQPQYYRFGEFVLDVSERTLLKDGEQTYLTPRTFDTLLALVNHHGELLEKERLVGLIWPGGVVSDNALTRCIKEVRTALGDEAGKPRFVETVPRVGYRFIAPVEALETMGEAARPPVMVRRWAVGCRVGCSNWSSEAGSIRATASASVIRPSSTMSQAIFSAALAVRFPLRVCSM